MTEHYTFRTEAVIRDERSVGHTLHASSIDDLTDMLVEAFEVTLGEGTKQTRMMMIHLIKSLTTDGLSVGSKITTTFVRGVALPDEIFVIERAQDLTDQPSLV